MILTCPACDTKYVIKDGAIPPGGRQVRCASCKHSWHQDPEIMAAEPATAVEMNLGGPPPAPAEPVEQPLANTPAQAEIGEPQPETPEDSPWGTVATEPVDAAMPPASSGADEVAKAEAPAVADEWRAEEPTAIAETEAVPATEDDFVGYAPIADDDAEGRRRWPLILTLLLLIAVAAAAFWFLAPPEWKARAGIAQAGLTPLQLMITTSDRQSLQSGNELVAISGRVINPTDREQQVPPIRAELRDRQSKKLVHRWTIAPPARVLAPRSSASFNSAEVDVPKGGDELTVTLER
jgi:predicted Zn finger-like uncharacterized protein